jgi:hypothetical protein
MGQIDTKPADPGTVIYRLKGKLSLEDLEKWRKELENHMKAHKEKGACGALIDVADVESFDMDALDNLIEVLAEPDDFFGGGIRVRFALIGVKAYTKRFLRDALPLEPIKAVQARFFHETSEDEALAWMRSMVESADDLPELAPVQIKPSSDGIKKVEPVKVDAAKTDPKREDNIDIPAKVVTPKEKKSDKPVEKKADVPQKVSAREAALSRLKRKS